MMKSPSRVPRHWCFLLLACCLACSSFAQKQPEASKRASVASVIPPDIGSPADYVGVERCQSCHKSETTDYFKTRHSDPSLVWPGKDYIQGCESCHGPGKAHSDSVQAAHGDDAEIARALREHPMFSFRGASNKISTRCMECHAGGTQHMNAINSVHSKNDVTCVSCHSPHHAAMNEFLLTKSQPDLCYSCHLQQKPQFNMPFHHRVNEGLIQCTDCHNPHGTVKAKQVRTAATQDAVCFTCHIDKQGPFVFEHQPVKVEGCQSCHTPHGSPNPNQLKFSNVNLLCLQCHTTSSFSAAKGTPSFHNLQTQFQACTLCHVQIHGSNFNRTYFK